ncbi:MAG: tetratricopeptide repeat protein, partial [Planctomycetes bacterium]|nr:tetratricopeptide repeat protein [Planctomycetota bacterium]
MTAKLEILWRIVILTYHKLLNWIEGLFQLKPLDEAQVYSRIGQKYADRGESDEAIPKLMKALELNPLDTEACYKLGVSCYKKGLYDDAVKFFTNVIGLDSRDADIYTHLGVIYNRKGLTNE